ncbi:MAG TPA: hypothetical protein VM581_01230, partial [Magnetospirillaceae bacterium]|nr:hypothetical protein [Magnetospirillaceae bacterium]
MIILGMVVAFAVVVSNRAGEKPSTGDHPHQLVGELTLETRFGIEVSSMQVFYSDGITSADKTAEHLGVKRINDLIARALGHFDNLKNWQLCRAELDAAAAVRVALVNEAIKLKSAEAAQHNTQRAEALTAATRLRQDQWIDCTVPGTAARWLTFDIDVDGVWRKVAIADSAVIDPMPTAEEITAKGLCVNKTTQLRTELIAKPVPNQGVELAKLD